MPVQVAMSARAKPPFLPLTLARSVAKCKHLREEEIEAIIRN
jgi:hypothetical protein